MGSLILAWLSIPFLAIAVIFLRCFKCCTKRSVRLKRWQTVLESWMFWNHPITVFNESASIIYMCCLINLQNPTFDTAGDKISTWMAIFFFVIATALPFALTFLMLKNSGRLNNQQVKQKYGAIYEGLNTQRGSKLAV